ncbi:MAG: DNA-processing protein DprA [Candidatus Falkowbacteria bacterium]|nr:DNA-processing protein DprA [Candidatus Falkowbacteria bacterium]
MLNTSQNHLKHLVLNHFPPIGPASYQKIINYFGDLEGFWTAPFEDYLRAGLKEEVAFEFINFRKNFTESALNKIRELLAEENIKLVAYEDDNYPGLLKEIDSPPPLLYYQGDLKILTKATLAIVGSRKNTSYANRVLNELVPSLPLYNIVTVSGLALGVDTLVHDLSLKNGGQTIAVLGSGLDRTSFYPRPNLKLRDEIIKTGGLIISEFAPLTPPLKTNFPRRNRLIAGLAPAVLVIEAGPKSGALITADYALDFNREVLAVPGSIYADNCYGPNNLIKQGAKIITEIKDILEIFGIASSPKDSSLNKSRTPILASPAEKHIYEILKDLESKGQANNSADKIIALSSLDTARVNSTLSTMEINGIIKNNFGLYSLLK